jgi:hypothetical protein
VNVVPLCHTLKSPLIILFLNPVSALRIEPFDITALLVISD